VPDWLKDFLGGQASASPSRDSRDRAESAAPVELPLQNEPTEPPSLPSDGDAKDGPPEPPRVDHLAIVKAAIRARPADVLDRPWKVAVNGLEAFLAGGHGDEALGVGWTKDELFAVPPLWSRVDLTGVGLMIGDGQVISISSSRIGIRTPNGSEQGFYRRPTVDYAVAYKAHLGLNRHETDAGNQEAQLRALERTVNLYREHHPGCSIEEAKAAVTAAIGRSSTKETTTS
jgi:hypothetical protein